MLEALYAMSALPNLHPALVHFPIALAAAALLFDLASVAVRRFGLAEAALGLWWLAAAGAGAAYLAGRSAADGLGLLAADVEQAVGAHADAAWWTLLAVCGVAALRTVARLWPAGGVPLLALGLLAGIAVQALIAWTADKGGALVFQHAVAVRTSEASEPAHGVYTPPGAPVRTPLEGMTIDVSGDGVLWLPGRWSDLQLELEIDAADFSGSWGLEVRADEDGGRLRLVVDRGATVRLSATGDTLLDEAPLSVPPSALALSLSGGHWKGFADERPVVHAHGSLATPRRVGLVLDGEGTVTLTRFAARPLDP